jgi:hypothetical protein
MRLRSGTALLAVLLATTLTSCASGSEPATPANGGARIITAGSVDVLVAQQAGAHMDALGGGRIEIVGGCLGADGSVIVWPHGTEVTSENPLTIEIPGGHTVTLGDNVRLGGGWILEHSSGDVPDGPFLFDGQRLAVPPPCAEHDIFLGSTIA